MDLSFGKDSVSIMANATGGEASPTGPRVHDPAAT